MTKEDFKLVIAKDKNPTGYKLSEFHLTDDAAKALEAALADCRDLVEIGDESDLQRFIHAETGLQDVMGQIVNSAKAFKEPYNRAHKLICAREKEVLAPLQTESNRLRAEMSRVYAERRRREIEEKSQLEEMETRARVQAMKEMDTEQEERLLEQAASINALKAQVVTTVPGLRLKVGWGEPVVIDPLKVMQTNPHLLDVTPRKSVIAMEIKALESRGVVIKEDTIPGIRLSPVNRASVRH